MDSKELFRTCKRVHAILTKLNYDEREFVMKYCAIQEQNKYAAKLNMDERLCVGSEKPVYGCAVQADQVP